MEWADDVILVHFKNQGTRIFIWQGGGKYRECLLCFVPFCITPNLTSTLLSLQPFSSHAVHYILEIPR
jgi:hypothetical protein